jgi:hypothetical protein
MRMKALIRDSLDDSQTGGDFYEYPVFCQGGSRLGRLPPPLAARTVVEGLIWQLQSEIARALG